MERASVTSWSIAHGTNVTSNRPDSDLREVEEVVGISAFILSTARWTRATVVAERGSAATCGCSTVTAIAITSRGLFEIVRDLAINSSRSRTACSARAI